MGKLRNSRQKSDSIKINKKILLYCVRSVYTAVDLLRFIQLFL